MNPELLHEARQLLARASVLSEVQASSVGKGRRGKPDSGRPKGSDWGVFDELAVLIGSCDSDLQLRRVVATARLELERWTNMSPDGVLAETTHEFRMRVLRQHAHRSVRETAAIENVKPNTIQRIRTWAKQQQEAA